MATVQYKAVPPASMKGLRWTTFVTMLLFLIQVKQ